MQPRFHSLNRQNCLRMSQVIGLSSSIYMGYGVCYFPDIGPTCITSNKHGQWSVMVDVVVLHLKGQRFTFTGSGLLEFQRETLYSYLEMQGIEVGTFCTQNIPYSLPLSYDPSTVTFSASFFCAFCVFSFLFKKCF